MNLRQCHPKKNRKFGKRQPLSQHQICCKNIRRKKSLSKNIRSDVKTSEVATLAALPSLLA